MEEKEITRRHFIVKAIRVVPFVSFVPFALALGGCSCSKEDNASTSSKSTSTPKIDYSDYYLKPTYSSLEREAEAYVKGSINGNSYCSGYSSVDGETCFVDVTKVEGPSSNFIAYGKIHFKDKYGDYVNVHGSSDAVFEIKGSKKNPEELWMTAVGTVWGYNWSKLTIKEK